MKVDCWAFGVILYFLLGSTFHVKDQDERLLKRAIVTEPFCSEALIKKQKTSSAIDLVQRLLHKEPTKRLTISAALRH